MSPPPYLIHGRASIGRLWRHLVQYVGRPSEITKVSSYVEHISLDAVRRNPLCFRFELWNRWNAIEMDVATASLSLLDLTLDMSLEKSDSRTLADAESDDANFSTVNELFIHSPLLFNLVFFSFILGCVNVFLTK